MSREGERERDKERGQELDTRMRPSCQLSREVCMPVILAFRKHRREKHHQPGMHSDTLSLKSSFRAQPQ